MNNFHRRDLLSVTYEQPEIMEVVRLWGSLTADRYIREVLEENVVPFVPILGENFILMHDNASNQRMEIISQLVNQKKEEDDVYLFMKSMGIAIKKLPPHLISQAKLQILTFVTNLQSSAEDIRSKTAPPATQTLLLAHSSNSVPSTSQLLCTTSSESTCIRLYNYEGEIMIDGVELKTLALQFLRQHISIIPQDPIMFSGTVRSNVDPLEEYTDEEIWKTLHKVQLDQAVPDLQTEVADVNFSTGQRQLICLARAIIRKNKILVLDEATANMDPETEQIAQKIIEENFSNCTMFIIAHRLDSVLKCNQVMVLDRGQIMEFDEPKNLLSNKNSMFSEMMRNAGIQEFTENSEHKE